jgi:uncharacterized protein (DUF934 family)
MIRKQHGDDIEEFIDRFRSNPRLRPSIVNDLITGAGRLTINVPRHGLARRIAERLREGPFSDYYEFEKLLARSLHPLMAGLNLNVVSDLQVNGLFSERYLVYSRDLNVALASGKKLTPGAIRKIIVAMAANEGHYMVIKFYDLVLRGIDADLCRSLKPVEEAVIRMKRALGDDEAANHVHVHAAFRKFREARGEAAAALLKSRMEWDELLRAYGANMEDDSGMAQPGEEIAEDMIEEESVADRDEDFDNADEAIFEKYDRVKPALRRDSEDVITRYARLIKQDYLDTLDPHDEERIRGIVRGMYLKNEKVYDSDRAADVVREVLAIWLADDSLDDGLRSILLEIAGEEEPGSGVMEEPDVNEPDLTEEHYDESAEGTINDNLGNLAPGTLSEETGTSEDMEPDHGKPAVDDGGGVSGNELDALLSEGIETVPADETKPLREEQEVQPDMAVPAEEMDILPDDAAGAAPGADGEAVPVHEDDATTDVGVSGGEMEALLDGISDEHPAVEEMPDSASTAVPDEGVSGGELEALLRDNPEEPPAGDPETAREPGLMPSDGSAASGGELDELLADISDEIKVLDEEQEPAAPAGPGGQDIPDGELEALLAGPGDGKKAGASAGVASAAVDEVFEPVLHEDLQYDSDAFVVKDEILFEDTSLVRKAPSPRAKPQKVRISLRDIADTESRKNLLDLVELLSKTESAGDVSRYLVGAGVSPAIKYGVTDLIGCNNFEEAFDRITGSEIFDYNEKIIILEKWLKVIGMKRGWFETPHENDLEKITKEVESYAAEIRNDAAVTDNEYLLDDQNTGSGTPGGDEAGSVKRAPVEFKEKEMLKTGDESIRLSREIYEFQSLYRAGAGRRTIGKKLKGIQKFFDLLASGEETAVHFAVYHNQSFADFLGFIEKNPDLKEMLDIDAALAYCRKKMIL